MRGDLTDEEWAIIGALLPPERGRWARPAQDNRRFLNGMLYVLRTGCPLRGLLAAPALRIGSTVC
jgi:transposase